MSEFTQILERADAGDSQAASDLLPLVYDELRRIAALHIGREAPGQTLQPTALVHEVWIRLGADDQRPWQNREHFVAAAVESMRRILVDRARAKLRLKRGANAPKVELEECQIAAPVADEKLLEVNAALDRLQDEDPALARIVTMRFFGGLTHDEVAAALGVNEKTVRRHWELARIRLFQLIDQHRD